MTRKLLCLLAGMLASAPSVAESTPVYASNYDVVLKAEGKTRRVHSRARVRDGHAIPVEFGRYKVDIHVSGRGDDGMEIELRLYEKSGGSWFRIEVEALSFRVQSEAPVEFRWTGVDIELDVALVVSVVPP